jgi:hypothetical protein
MWHGLLQPRGPEEMGRVCRLDVRIAGFAELEARLWPFAPGHIRCSTGLKAATLSVRVKCTQQMIHLG